MYVATYDARDKDVERWRRPRRQTGGIVEQKRRLADRSAGVAFAAVSARAAAAGYVMGCLSTREETLPSRAMSMYYRAVSLLFAL
jgi:hypothetical protein